jgi:hypothetical protein
VRIRYAADAFDAARGAAMTTRTSPFALLLAVAACNASAVPTGDGVAGGVDLEQGGQGSVDQAAPPVTRDFAVAQSGDLSSPGPSPDLAMAAPSSDMAGCGASGATCAMDGDCCPGWTCVNGQCATSCAGAGHSCDPNQPFACCNGMSCNPSTMTCGSCGPPGAACSSSRDCCNRSCNLGTYMCN